MRLFVRSPVRRRPPLDRAESEVHNRSDPMLRTPDLTGRRRATHAQKERPTARARRLSSPIKGRGAGARVEQPMASCAFFHKYKSRPSGDPNFYLRDPKCSAGKVARSARLVPKGPGRAARSAGDLVQWVERMFCTHEATGSSPVVSKNAHGGVFFFSALLKDQKKGRSLTRVPSRACDQVWWDSVGRQAFNDTRGQSRSGDFATRTRDGVAALFGPCTRAPDYTPPSLQAALCWSTSAGCC